MHRRSRLLKHSRILSAIDKDFRIAIIDHELDLRFGQSRAHRNGDRSDSQGRVIPDGKRGHVGQHNGDSVAGLDAVLLQ